ncbi:RNA polymerase sigma factor [Cohnella sp. WQ 127256]|uniref:RNA polymerase sigma factor n=1 Tax=Cohnella sp. WQ 127256 TaxID=2938790 RepID=UPI002117C635|nr:RNA polymerase sigma factor [Cohnella sp. WQ 127256]
MILVDNIHKATKDEENPNVVNLQTVLKRYCLSLTESTWDAEDLVQETWLKAISLLQSVGHLNTEAYLLRIAKNTWIDHTRRKTVLDRILKAERSRASQPDQGGTFEIEAIFQALIKHLSPLQRAVFLLRDVLEYPIAETAAKLGTTEGAVKAALHRARQSLRLVQDDIEKDVLSLPEDEGLKTYLRIIAAAYRMGDMATLIQLVQMNEMEPAMAISMIHSKQLHKSYKSQSPTMLAA